MLFDEFDRVVFARGQQIFKYGDPGDCAYLIEEGAVEVLVMNSDKEPHIKLIGKGELFGEISLIDYQPRTVKMKKASGSGLAFCLPTHQTTISALITWSRRGDHIHIGEFMLTVLREDSRRLYSVLVERKKIAARQV